LGAVKTAGGLTLAQEENQAKYPGMPASAIDSGLVDFVSPAEEMPATLIEYTGHVHFRSLPDHFFRGAEGPDGALSKVFAFIRSRTGHDFSSYKTKTILRRISRRIALHRIETLDDYVHFLERHPEEVEALFKDLLIGVTSFFRDSDAWEALARRVLPEWLENLPSGASLRIWVPGCATGEEAYSLAMLFVESMEETQKHVNLQIFGTDIDADAVAAARRGEYTDEISTQVSPERLHRYFIREGDRYIIKKRIRDMVIFAEQNLIKDPPFSKIDMISCRNLLIYLDSNVQKRLVPLFHHVLNENGILFLGSSESIGEFTDLFSPVESRWKIYRRRSALVSAKSEHLRLPYDRGPYSAKPRRPIPVDSARNKIKELAERTILENYSPSCVLVNERFEILYFGSHTDAFLKPPAGEASFNLLKMARDALKYKLSAVLHQARKQRKPVIYRSLRLESANGYQTIDLIVSPLLDPAYPSGLLLVLFEYQDAPEIESDETDKAESGEKPTAVENSDSRIKSLEQELYSTKEYLQTTIEELETSNEELKSTNEELETSKEELQSTNEELVTVNAELQQKVSALFESNSDMDNLLASMDIGTVFLDTELRIKRYTPRMTELFNLIASDVGRPISDITSRIAYPPLYADAAEVLQSLVRTERMVQSEDGRLYSMRILPYRTIENMIDGVVITFVEKNDSPGARRGNEDGQSK
jgi:two-component system CheB/CheR fusion protein